MGNEIDIINKVFDNSDFEISIIKVSEKILDKLNQTGWSFSITFTDDNEIALLNKEWRNKKGPTDVLTFVMDEGEPFPQGDAPFCPGDIVISLERVIEQAEEYKQSREKELKRLLVHGILHLMGMTHDDYDWNKGMLKKQEEILEILNESEVIGWNDGLV